MPFIFLCHSLSLLPRKLCTSHVEHSGIAPLLASSLVALNKSPGVRPIGIGKAKAMLLMQIFKIMWVQNNYVQAR